MFRDKTQTTGCFFYVVVFFLNKLTKSCIIWTNAGNTYLPTYLPSNFVNCFLVPYFGSKMCIYNPSVFNVFCVCEILPLLLRTLYSFTLYHQLMLDIFLNVNTWSFLSDNKHFKVWSAIQTSLYQHTHTHTLPL